MRMVWSEKLTKCLINERLSKGSHFSMPNCKKMKLWQSVAQEVTKQSGVKVDGTACYNKYRGLLTTYTNNNKKSTEDAITWPYFDTFDQVLGTNASSMPPKLNIGDSLDITSEEENDLQDDVTSDAPTDSDLGQG